LTHRYDGHIGGGHEISALISEALENRNGEANITCALTYEVQLTLKHRPTLRPRRCFCQQTSFSSA